MIRAKVRGNPKLPKLDLSKLLGRVAEEIVIPTMQEGIHQSVDIHGTGFPRLETSTITAKRRKGLRLEPLQATGELRRAFKWVKRGRNKVIVTLNKTRKDIGRYLAFEGVGKARKKFRFFGVSEQSEARSVNLAFLEIEKQIRLKTK